MKLLKRPHDPDIETIGDKAADAVRNGMGSWPFVFGFLVSMGTWAYLNSVVLKEHAFDPYPYILLNLILSTLAGLQGAILLIAAKRADALLDKVIKHINDMTEHIQLNTDKIAKETDQIDGLIIENTDLTKEIHNLAKLQAEHIKETKKRWAKEDESTKTP